MTNRIVELHVDHFSTTGIVGWAISIVDKAIETCPLFFVIGKHDFANVDEFIFRNDIEDAAFGTGMYGFSIQKDLPLKTQVEIYDKTSARRLWTGTIGVVFVDTVRVELFTSEDLSMPILKPEGCLRKVTNQGIASRSGHPADGLCLFQLNLCVHGQPLYYFQTIHSESTVADFEVIIDGFVVTRRVVGQLNDYILCEYFVANTLYGKEAATLPKLASIKFIANTSGLTVPVTLQKPDRESIFVFASGNSFVLRPNVKIDFAPGAVIPIIAHPLNLGKGLTASVSKNSVICVSEVGKVAWAPERSSIPASDAPYFGARNIVSNAFLNADLWSNNPTMDIEVLMRYYEKQGSRKFVEALYSHLLQRDGDKDGVNDVTNDFNNKIANGGIFAAIHGIWHRFISSDEFKNQPFRIFAESFGMGDTLSKAEDSTIISPPKKASLNQALVKIQPSRVVELQLHPNYNEIKSVDDLLQLEGEFFVEAAYQKILLRKSDPSGLNYYVEKLKNGYSKLNIIKDLRNSSEGRSLVVILSGLEDAISGQSFKRVWSRLKKSVIIKLN